MTESTYILALGALEAADTRTVGSVNYARTITSAVLATADGHNVSADTTVKVTVAGTAVGSNITILSGTKTIAVDLSATSIGVDAAAALGLEVQTTGERDLVLTLTFIVVETPGTDVNWVTPTAAMLQSAVSAPEYAAFTSSVIRGAQADPVPQILSDLVQTVRSLASRVGKLGQAGTIPSSVLRYVKVLGRADLFSRVTALNWAEKHQKEIDNANDVLKKLAAGDWPVEPPDSPLTTQPFPGGDWGSDTKVDL